MNRKLFLSLLFFSLLLVNHGYSLDGRYLYTSLSYGRGWRPWECVVERGLEPYVHGHRGLPSCTGAWRYCPFEYATMGGEKACNFDFAGLSLNQPPIWGLVVDINIPEDIKLIDPDGYVINDEVCVGDRFKISKGENRGEWWERGGHEDSPPIYWVDDVKKIVLDMMNYHDNTFIAKEDVCQMTSYPDGYVDPLFNLPIYTIPVLNYHSQRDTLISGNLVCSLKEKDVGYYGPINFDDEFYTVLDSGNIDFNVNTVVECMYYYFGSKGGYCFKGASHCINEGSCEFYKYSVPTVIQAGPDATENDAMTHNVEYNSIEDFFKIGEISFQKRLKVVEDNIFPNLKHSFSISDSFPRIAKINIKNEGNGKASITKVYSGTDYEFVVCDKEELNPREETECILKINSNDNFGLFFDYEYKDCGRLKEKKVVVKSGVTLDTCLSDNDCSTGLCCENFCRDPNAGFCDDVDRDGVSDTWIPT